MIFFLILPLWVLCTLSGIALLFLPQRRRIGVYFILVSTAAMLVSFVLSTAVLYLAGKFGSRLHIQWLGLAVIATYLMATGLGLIVGGLAGFFLARNLLVRRLPG